MTLNQWAEGSSPSEVTEDKPLTKVGGFSFGVDFWLFLKFTSTEQFAANIGYFRDKTDFYFFHFFGESFFISQGHKDTFKT